MAPCSLTPCISPADDDAPQVTTIMGSVAFFDLTIEEFTTAVQDNFVMRVADVANVDPSFVKVTSVASGSVVVEWSVAVPKDSLSPQDLSGQLLQRLTDDQEVDFGVVAIVSGWMTPPPLRVMTAPLHIHCRMFLSYNDEGCPCLQQIQQQFAFHTLILAINAACSLFWMVHFQGAIDSRGQDACGVCSLIPIPIPTDLDTKSNRSDRSQRR